MAGKIKLISKYQCADCKLEFKDHNLAAIHKCRQKDGKRGILSASSDPHPGAAGEK